MASKARKTKTKILDAAQQVILDRGFAATSIDAIQEAAGISRGTFFYHFPTKDDLSRALIGRYAEADRTLTDEFMKRAENMVRDPAQQVLIFLALHEEMFAEMTGMYPGCLFASYSYEAGLFDEETQNVVNGAVEYWRILVGRKLKEAMSRRSPKIVADPYVLADTAYAVLQGAFILSRLRDDASVMVHQIRQVRNYLELLFGERDGAKSPPSLTPAKSEATG